MTFIRFLFFKIYRFYQRFWPNSDPELYAYLFVVFIATLNFSAIHMFYMLVVDPHDNTTLIVPIASVVLFLVLGYFAVLKGGRYKKLSQEDFKGVLYNGRIANVFVISYIFLSVILVLLVAYLLRQYHI